MSFDKTGYQLTLFPLQPSTSDDANHGNGFVQKEPHFIFKNLCKFEDLELTDPRKNMQQQDRQRHHE